MIVMIGLLIGILLGLFLDVKIPDAYTTYLTIAILTCLDSVLGALKAYLGKTFDNIVFISGFFGNAIIAVALTFLGDKLGLPMYLAAVVVFGGRIFNNFAVIRRLLIDKYYKGKRNDALE
ncbi:small basic family protein [Proteiniclasticum sp. SCR006]|uniref:Small basic family protein n=1 Tax=Proteiniclasticum aestuarii TaxID=2817862 RepID=A0A939KJJ8_9CLOT|nr:small basic family protein [Proteiniclasticum aestuarii]MBO1263760.1 small basic family protein [Proteiniclasticum aestuarii]